MGVTDMRRTAVFIVLVMVFAVFSATVQGQYEREYSPHPVEQASTFAPLVPMKNAFVVRYDGGSLVDDLAYISAVPAAVIYDSSDDIVYSAPLLFWEPERGLSGADLPQDSAGSLDYFMEDWLTYSDNELDNIQFINMDPSEVDEVNGRWNVSTQTSKQYYDTNPYTIAKDIALYNWRYSDVAYLAVVDDTFPELDEITEGEVGGQIPGKDIKEIIIIGEKEPSPINPNMHPFTVEPDYKYITSDMVWFGPSGLDTVNSLTQRGRDPDLQLYDMELGEVAASEEWNVLSGVGEYIGSYVYHEGQWASAVTYMPTEDMALNEVQGKDISKLPPRPEHDSYSDWMLNPPRPGSSVTYEITNTMYPGMDIELPDETPFMGRDAEFTLQWSGGADLGLLVRGPSGAVIAEDLGQGNPKTLTVKDMGMGRYSVTAVKLSQGTESVAFNVTYKWHQ
jgi:hypothetical protein